jgi:hypothetical protein
VLSTPVQNVAALGLVMLGASATVRLNCCEVVPAELVAVIVTG